MKVARSVTQQGWLRRKVNATLEAVLDGGTVESRPQQLADSDFDCVIKHCRGRCERPRRAQTNVIGQGMRDVFLKYMGASVKAELREPYLIGFWQVGNLFWQVGKLFWRSIQNTIIISGNSKFLKNGM